MDEPGNGLTVGSGISSPDPIANGQLKPFAV